MKVREDSGNAGIGRGEQTCDLVKYFAGNYQHSSREKIHWKDNKLPNILAATFRRVPFTVETSSYSLLQKIANSVSDDVHKHIKNIWIMQDLREAMHRIFEILEDLCGDPRSFIKTAIQKVKRATCKQNKADASLSD